MRGDLLKRHMDRHAAKGSQLNQRDSMAGHIAPVIAPGSKSPENSRNHIDYSKTGPSNMSYQPQQDNNTNPYSSMSTTPTGIYQNGVVTNGMDSYGSQNHGFESRTPQLNQPHSPSVSQRASISATSGPFGVMSPIANQHGFQTPQSHTPQVNTFIPQQNVMPMNLPPSQFSNAQNSMSRDPSQNFGTGTSVEYSEPTSQAGEMMMLDQMAMPGTVPVFGGDGDLNKSPYVGMPEDFMAFLFNSPSSAITPMMAPGYAK